MTAADLRQRQIQVTGPEHRGEESIYRVNEHTLTETELQRLAHDNQLTSWEIFNYVKIRDQK